LSSVYFEVFCEKLVQLQTLDSLAISRSGRRILQRYKLLSTTFFTAADQKIEAPPVLPETSNSLILKEFSAPTTLEVGRIIRGSERASTLNFNKPQYC
ncbi:hypothetical protein KW869_05010, partial [Pseudomonas urmiensis]